MKTKIKNKIYLGLLLVCLAVLGFALYQIGSILWGYHQAGTEYNKIKEDFLNKKELGVLVDYTAINPDYLAWLELPGTNINYPVVQGKDNVYYLTHTFENQYNRAGTVFADMLCEPDFSSQNTILYGHNMKNSTMFSDIEKYLDTTFYNENKEIIIHTSTEILRYEICAARRTDIADSVYQIEFQNQGLFTSFLAQQGAPENVDNVLTLSTCTNMEEDGRIVVVAYLVSREQMADL